MTASELTDLDAMRDFAAGLPEDVGPLFGRDVVRLIDRYKTQVDALEAIASALEWTDEQRAENSQEPPA